MDLFQAVETSPLNSERIRYHLDKIRQAQVSNGDLGEAISAAVNEFNTYFLNYGKPYFKVNKLAAGVGRARSEEYNETMETLQHDLERLYALTESAAQTTLAAYNYSSIASEQIKNSAAEAASKVLDLNVLNNFVKGQVIVAGDDFLDSSKIDTSIQPETSQAEILEGASSIGLKVESAERVSLPGNTTIRITPLSPTNSDGSVNLAPSPENVQRFYEGHFYAPIGEQRPEGGSLKFKYIVDPAKLPENIVQKVTDNGQVTSDEGYIEAQVAVSSKVGYYALVQSSESDLQEGRLKMIDGSPDTFWEAEFIYTVPSLI